MATPTMRQRIEERYPDMVALLGIPEVGNLLTLAVQQNWSPGQFRSHFIASKWFRTQSESARRWWVTTATDPGEAAQQRSAMGSAIRQAAAQFGTKLTGDELRYLTNSMLIHGQSPSGPELQRALAGLWSFKDRGYGAAGAARNQVESLYSAYFNNMVGEDTRSHRALLDRRALAIAQGTDSIEALQERLKMQAMKRFPHMADMLAAGMTVAEIVNPLRSVVAKELEYTGPEQVDLNNPLWRQLLGIRDPKTNKMRMPTESEAMRMARAQPQWWQTSNGRQLDASGTSAMLEKMGMRA
jgi:hypothetical protein